MTPPSDRPPASRPEPPSEEAPGLPRFRTWRGVYLFVLGWFAVVVALLAWFTHAFS